MPVSDSLCARDRTAIIFLAVLLHALLLAVYWARPLPPAVLVDEMSVSFASHESPQAATRPKHVQREPDPVVREAEKQVEQPQETQQASPAPEAPVVLDTEPDFRASYLNNPRPPYPLLARRMGYEGKVILNVEVLAEGHAGQVLLQQSCGHDILDRAALETVRTWRFVPARHMGQAVTQWFLLPIRFSLSEKG
jgi:protein TonB